MCVIAVVLVVLALLWLNELSDNNGQSNDAKVPENEITEQAQPQAESEPSEVDEDNNSRAEEQNNTENEMITVPNIVGKTLNDAEECLIEAGFTIGEINYDHSDDIEKGCVLYQQYESGQELEKGTSIGFVISLGP